MFLILFYQYFMELEEQVLECIHYLIRELNQKYMIIRDSFPIGE